MSYFDIGYFSKKVKRASFANKRRIKNKIIAWNLNKEYYDGSRINGYGGFKYDGRWKKFLPKIIKRYKLTNKSKVLEIGCKKGFLIQDLQELLPGIKAIGIENHRYPISKASVKVKNKLYLKNYYDLEKFKRNQFDLIIAFNSIYMQNLGDIIKTLTGISRISKYSYISLASFEKKIDRDKFFDWTLLDTTNLKTDDWKSLFKQINFRGNYYFSEAKKLGL